LKKSTAERELHQKHAALLKEKMSGADLPVMPSESHIVPLLVGDAAVCKQASDLLLEDFGLYVQPINYPTVARGTERLRFTPSPVHTEEMMDYLVSSLKVVWARLDVDKYASAA
jgi:5-aminolevulinate synthase